MNSTPTDFDILKITTAYEQGVGKGQSTRTSKNPYIDDTCKKSWDMGFSEGQSLLDRSKTSLNQTLTDGYRSEFLRVSAEGYDAAKSNMNQTTQTENPYDFSNENINHSAFEVGYYFYLSSVH